MKCSQCDHENREGARFCENCGQALPAADKTAGYRQACIWYYQHNGISKGPFTKKELKKLKEAGLIFARTPILQEGLSQWVPYESLASTLAMEEARKQPVQPDGWHVYKDNVSLGPYSQEQFEKLIKEGAVNASHLVCEPGSRKFIPFLQCSLAQTSAPAAQPTQKQEEVWYYTQDDHPVKASRAKMIERINQGSLKGDSLVWSPGLPGWVPLKDSSLGSCLPLDVMGKNTAPEPQGWMLSNAGLKLGPFDESTMIQAIAAQEDVSSAQVLKPGWKNWKPLIKSRWLIYTHPEGSGWYLLENETASGPYSAQDLAKWLSEESLAPDTLVWHEGYAQWMPVDQIKPELARSVKSQASPFQQWRNGMQQKNRDRFETADEPIWYLGINQQTSGPFPAGTIQKRFAAGQIDEHTLVWKKGLPDWVEYQDSSLYKTRPAEEQWFYVDGNQSKGPFTYQQMRQMYYNKKINDYTWVWRQGMADWTAYKDSQLAY